MRKILSVIFIMLFSLNAYGEVKVGDEPKLSGKLTNGRNFDIKHMNKKLVIINYWASWCSVCRHEIPLLNNIYNKYKNNGLEIIGISINDLKYKKGISNFAQKNISFPVAMFAELSSDDFGEPESIPLNYIIDKNGQIVSIIDPREDLSLEDLEEVIEDELNL